MSTKTQDINTECINTCNSLLRGELSAVETYEKAIAKYPSEKETATLCRIKEEHQASVRDLQENIKAMCGIPDTDSGSWGTFATAVQDTANLFGEESAMAALKQGEKHGENEYLEAIDNDSTLPACRTLIQTRLLPRVKAHVQTIDSLS